LRNRAGRCLQADAVVAAAIAVVDRVAAVQLRFRDPRLRESKLWLRPDSVSPAIRPLDVTKPVEVVIAV